MAEDEQNQIRHERTAYTFLFAVAFGLGFFAFLLYFTNREYTDLYPKHEFAYSLFLNLATELIGAAAAFWVLKGIFLIGIKDRQKDYGTDFEQANSQLRQLNGEIANIKQQQSQLSAQLDKMPYEPILTKLDEVTRLLTPDNLNQHVVVTHDNPNPDAQTAEFHSRVRDFIDLMMAKHNIEIADVTSLRDLGLISSKDEKELKAQISSKFDTNANNTPTTD